MGIENELVKFLESNIKDGSKKSRDIEIIKFYYGLKESPWPTLEETATRFGVGTRERIRQLLNSKFREHVNISDIPSLNDFVKILKSREYWLVTEFENEIYTAGLIGKETYIKGIFNLIKDVGIVCGFDFFTPDLKRATRNSIKASKNSFLIKVSDLKEVAKLLKKAQGLPGRCGVANLNYIESELGEYYQLISLLIESSPTSWVKVDGDDYWYVFENKNNTVINYSEKVFLVIDSCDSGKLATVFRNALDGRTYKYPYPPSKIMEEYLKSSVYFVNTDTGLKFIGETTKLNEIEEDLISFFDSSTSSSFPQLDQYLSQKKYGRPHITKTTNFSPLVFVDKSQGRKHYVYSLIGQRVSLQKAEPDLTSYESYTLRLRALLALGTDKAREQTTRKEQHILQEWLFKDKTHENCTICGQEFSIKTLVAAHKKPRSDCNDAERLDPYIVMPLCLMGCDYLYENMYIYIDEKEIKRGLEFSNARAESAFIEELIGREVDSKWLLGNEFYFRSPNKALQRTSR
jgi:hypothetical protein